MLDDLVSALVLAAQLLLAAAASYGVAWLRLQRQKFVIERATLEAEAQGQLEPLSGRRKKVLAMELTSSRLGRLTIPSPEQIDKLIEEAVERQSLPPK